MDPDPALLPVSRFDWERYIRRAGIRQSAKATALIISTYADSDGTRIKVGVETLAESCNAGTATIKRHLADLRDAGFLWRTRQGDRHRGMVDEYRLTVAYSFISEAGRQGPKGNVCVSSVIPRKPRKRSSPAMSGDHLSKSGDHLDPSLGITGDPPPTQDQPTTNPEPHVSEVSTERGTIAAITDLPRPGRSPGHQAAIALLEEKRRMRA